MKLPVRGKNMALIVGPKEPVDRNGGPFQECNVDVWGYVTHILYDSNEYAPPTSIAGRK